MFGGLNPFPRKFGRRTPTYLRYLSLLGAMGENGVGPPGGIDDLWYRCVARIMAASHGSVRRAFYQFFAHTMGPAMLSTWELRLQLPEASSLGERQQAVAAAITFDPDTTYPALAKALRRIDPAFAVEMVPFAQVAHMRIGRSFGPLPGVDYLPFRRGAAIALFGTSARAPMYSDSSIVHVRYLLPAGVTEIPPASLARAQRHLNEVLPSHVDFVVYNRASGPDGDGFYLDGGPDGDSLLDQTAFG